MFTSQNGALNIQIIAKANPIPSITFTSPSTGRKIHPTGFGYEICEANGTGCVWDYGGVRLALTQSDTLKVHFINQLPKFDPKKLLHAADPSRQHLPQPDQPAHPWPADPGARADRSTIRPSGDYIFVQVFNPANGTPKPASKPHKHGRRRGRADRLQHPGARQPCRRACSGTTRMCTASRSNRCPAASRPSSPSASIGDNVSGDASNAPFPEANVRHMMLKEIQVAAAGTRDFGSRTGGRSPTAKC